MSDLVEELRELHSQMRISIGSIGERAADEIERLRAELEEANRRYESNDGMDGAVCDAIRKVLYEGEVPLAAFIDDHVANAIIQRNQLREQLVKAADILRKASLQRDCFHVSGTPLKNAAGTTLFIDANKIDAALAEIEKLSLPDETGK